MFSSAAIGQTQEQEDIHRHHNPEFPWFWGLQKAKALRSQAWFLVWTASPARAPRKERMSTGKWPEKKASWPRDVLTGKSQGEL